MSNLSKQDVFNAADELLAEGVKPSQQLVREKLGRGSATTIHRILNDWWKDIGKRLNTQSQNSTAPMPVQKALEELWRISCKQAEVQRKEQELLLRDRLKTERHELAAEKQQFASKLERLSEQLASAYQNIDTLQRELNSQKELNMQLDKQLYQATVNLEKTTNENKVLEKIIKQMDK